MSSFDSRRLRCWKYAIGKAVMASDGSEHHFARRDVAIQLESTTAEFQQLTDSTPLQRRVLDLLSTHA